MSNYIPTYQHFNRMPVDISFVFESERPAGKHGFVTVPEGKDSFYFEDGTPARFWGVILNGAANFPEKGYAEQIADRLMQAGVNYVRFHQLDSEWATPNYYRCTAGKRITTTRVLCPESMDRLDWWIKVLKERGIYACIDMCTYRKFKSGDGVKFADQFDDNVKCYAHFDPVMIELQKEFCTTFWNHENPYTGLKYKDDPFFLACIISNENDTFKDHKASNKYGTKIPYYEEMIESAFADWLTENGHGERVEIRDGRKTVRDYVAYDKKDTLQAEFRMAQEKKYAEELYRHIRSLGVRIPIADTNWGATNGLTFAQETMDFNGGNNYFYDWLFGETEKRGWNNHILAKPTCHLAGNYAARTAGHPFYQTEWNMPWPNSYRAEGPVWYPAVNAFNGASGMSIHTYCYSTYLRDDLILGKESPTNGIGGVPYREGLFAVWNDPAIFGLFYLGALMLRRGDVSPAKKTIGARVTDPNLWSFSRQLTESAMEVHKVVIVPHGISDEEAKKKYGLDEIRPAEEPFTQEEKMAVLNELADQGKHFLPKDSKNVIMSDTGELWRDTAKQIGAVDTPRTKIAYGMLNKETKAMTGKPYEVKLNGMTVVCNTDFAVVGLSSLNDKPIKDSDNMLLCTVGRASNTDTWFDGEKLVKHGHLPIQAEVIDAVIEVETDVEDLRVWSVTDDGFYGGRIPVEKLDGKIRFHVGPNWPSRYYLIMKE